jgi:hypothetical protein
MESGLGSAGQQRLGLRCSGAYAKVGGTQWLGRGERSSTIDPIDSSTGRKLAIDT